MLRISAGRIVELKSDATLKLPVSNLQGLYMFIHLYLYIFILCYLGGVGIVRIPPLEVDVRSPRLTHNATV